MIVDACYPDSSKNKAAMDIITRLTSSCCWLNLHIVPPHGVVFEIRDADAYGARWSEDGSKVQPLLLSMSVMRHESDNLSKSLDFSTNPPYESNS